MAGEVNDFRLPDRVDAREARRMSRFELFAVACVEEALASAGLKLENEDPASVGAIIGSGIGSLTTTQHECGILAAKGGMKINPFLLPMMLPNMATAQVSRLFNIQGYTSTIVTACASGGQSIGEAGEVIRRGGAEVMIAGGAEASICAMGLAGFAVLRALSLRTGDPKRASRPFDRNRDGLVPSEAAALFVLESLEHAQARGAKIVAELVGYGATSDAHHVVAPHPEGRGAAQATRLALRQAGLAPTEVDYINAHATATPLGDAAETKALKAALGEHAYSVPISATKSMIGHAMGAAGAVGALAAVLAIRDGVVHPTINYETPDPECDLDYVPNEARRVNVRVALSNAFAFGGHNTVLAFKRFE
jgi:3-oxoacyl-[acyl-carrier-protein] synthase II